MRPMVLHGSSNPAVGIGPAQHVKIPGSLVNRWLVESISRERTRGGKSRRRREPQCLGIIPAET